MEPATPGTVLASRRAAALAALAAAVVLALPAAAAADCYVVYDDGFRQTMKRVFGADLPKRAGHLASMAECQAELQRVFDDPQYRNDAGLRRTTCGCDGDGDEGGRPAASSGWQAPSGGSFQQQLVAGVVSRLVGAIFAYIDAPPGADGELLRKQLQQEWDQQEKARSAAEARRRQVAFQQAAQAASGQLAGRPSPADPPATGGGAVYLGVGTVPALLRASGAVTEAEWAEARAWQARIDLLRARRTLTAAEARELASLEARRNARWRRAVEVPGLTQRDRDALKLKLHVTEGGAAAGTMDALLETRALAAADPSKAPAGVLTSLTEASVTFGVQTGVETVAEEYVDLRGAARAEAGQTVLRLGDVLFAAQAAQAARDGKIEEAAGPGFSWMLGRLATKVPALGLATVTVQGTAAVTSTLVRREFEALVEKTDQLVPGMLPPGGTGEDWWKEMKSELTLPQKFIAEGVGL